MSHHTLTLRNPASTIASISGKIRVSRASDGKTLGYVFKEGTKVTKSAKDALVVELSGGSMKVKGTSENVIVLALPPDGTAFAATDPRSNTQMQVTQQSRIKGCNAMWDMMDLGVEARADVWNAQTGSAAVRAAWKVDGQEHDIVATVSGKAGNLVFYLAKGPDGLPRSFGKDVIPVILGLDV